MIKCHIYIIVIPSFTFVYEFRSSLSNMLFYFTYIVAHLISYILSFTLKLFMYYLFIILKIEIIVFV